METRMQVIMLPTEKPSFLQKRTGNGPQHEAYPKGTLAITTFDNIPDPDKFWEHQFLYLCSDREIKENDWVIWQRGDQFEIIKAQVVKPEIQTIKTDYGKAWYHTDFCKKIEASTDTSLGLPNIPTEFIQEYVEKYNEGDPITEVLVEMNCHAYADNLVPEIWYTPKVKSDNTITILKVEETWDDIKKEYKKVVETWNTERYGYLTFENFVSFNYMVPKKLKQ